MIRDLREVFLYHVYKARTAGCGELFAFFISLRPLSCLEQGCQVAAQSQLDHIGKSDLFCRFFQTGHGNLIAELTFQCRSDHGVNLLAFTHGVDNIHNICNGADGTKRTAVDTLTTGNTFLIVNHSDASVRIHLQGIHRTALTARTHQIRDGVVWTGSRTFTALFTFGRINVCLVHADGDGAEITGIIAGLSHTVLTVVGNSISCDRTFLAGRRNHINNLMSLGIIRDLTHWRFALRQIHSLSDDFSFFIDTASELCFRSRNHLIRNLFSFFLELSLISQLCNSIQHFMFDLQNCCIIRNHK